MAQPISALKATIPLSSDCSSFISKSRPQPSTFLKSCIPNASQNSRNSIVSMAGGGDRDHLQRASKPQAKRRPEAAPLGLWDRFPTARTVQQMLEDPLTYTSPYPSPTPPTQNGSFSRGRTPWEIKEQDSEYKMRFDMPGMTKEDVKVWVEENMLVVQAEKAPKKKKNKEANDNSTTLNGNVGDEVQEEEEEEDWPAKSFGRYRCMIALPENMQFEKIKAEVRDGVLYITIPKAIVSAKVLDIAVQ